jgi:hypothetical protein
MYFIIHRCMSNIIQWYHILFAARIFMYHGRQLHSPNRAMTLLIFSVSHKGLFVHNLSGFFYTVGHTSKFVFVSTSNNLLSGHSMHNLQTKTVTHISQVAQPQIMQF